MLALRLQPAQCAAPMQPGSTPVPFQCATVRAELNMRRTPSMAKSPKTREPRTAKLPFQALTLSCAQFPTHQHPTSSPGAGHRHSLNTHPTLDAPCSGPVAQWLSRPFNPPDICHSTRVPINILVLDFVLVCLSVPPPTLEPLARPVTCWYLN